MSDKAEHVIDDDELRSLQRQMIGDEVAQIVRHRGRAFHVDDRCRGGGA